MLLVFAAAPTKAKIVIIIVVVIILYDTTKWGREAVLSVGGSAPTVSPPAILSTKSTTCPSATALPSLLAAAEALGLSVALHHKPNEQRRSTSRRVGGRCVLLLCRVWMRCCGAAATKMQCPGCRRQRIGGGETARGGM